VLEWETEELPKVSSNGATVYQLRKGKWHAAADAMTKRPRPLSFGRQAFKLTIGTPAIAPNPRQEWN
jgi:hypothetical protein